jgi:hypothetical protein
MAETVAPELPTREQIAANRWLPDDELAVYAPPSSHAPGCRVGCSGTAAPSIRRTARSCACSADGASRCRAASSPAARTGACSRCPATTRPCRPALCEHWHGSHLIDGAGHWVQQEQPQAVCPSPVHGSRTPATSPAQHRCVATMTWRDGDDIGHFTRCGACVQAWGWRSRWPAAAVAAAAAPRPTAAPPPRRTRPPSPRSRCRRASCRAPRPPSPSTPAAPRR